MKKPDELKKYLGIAALIFVIWQVYRIIQTMGQAAKAAAGRKVFESEFGLTKAEADLCSLVGVKVYDAIWNYYGGMSEDEDTVINQLNTLTNAAQARAVSMFYNTMEKGTSLKSDIQKFLSSSQQERINITIRSNLQ